MDIIFKNEMKKGQEIIYSLKYILADSAYIIFAYIWVSLVLNSLYSLKSHVEIKIYSKLLQEIFQCTSYLVGIMILFPAIALLALSMIEIIPINKISKWFCPRSRVLCYLYSKYGDECKLLQCESTHLKIGTTNDYVIVPMHLVTFAFDPLIDKVTLCVNRKYIKLSFPISGYSTKENLSALSKTNWR